MAGRFVCRRLCCKYKYFFFAATLVMCFQLFLGYKFTLYASSQKGPTEDQSLNGPFSKKNARNGHLKNGKDPPVATATNIVVETNEQQPAASQGAPLLYKPKCHISEKQAVSAIGRSKTSTCKQEIADVVCLQLAGKLYPTSLPNTCPVKGNHSRGHYYGCFRDSMVTRDFTHHIDFLKDNTPTRCINHCIQAGFRYAAVQYSKECWCGDKFGAHGPDPETHCNSPCTGDKRERCGGYLTNRVFSTGLAEKIKNEVSLMNMGDKIPQVRIVFVLTLNGRAVRQVNRLLKAIYHRDHYYYIHVDQRQDYMFRELIPLETKFPNIVLTKTRFSTIWGGASLLQAHLNFLKELLQMEHWNWDYYVNLSESDYPIKKVETLRRFLSKYKGFSFLKSHGRDTSKFIQKQGLEHTFYECDNHLWRLCPRKLPAGVRIDGGSDWVGLHRDFCKYVINSKDELIMGLKAVYKYSLLPAESFFHTLLQNSKFCQKSVDNNLHTTNWRRKQGCKCQYKHIVDWCGCSPNDFKDHDLDRLMAMEQKPIFFARKFEPIVNQEIINSLDTYLFGSHIDRALAISSYWQNEYHHLDLNTKKKDGHHSFYQSFVRRGIREASSNTDCSLRPHKLLEANVFYEADHFHGVLVLYEAEHLNTGRRVTMETHIQWNKFYRVISPTGPIGRLLSLEVGTDFDLKELIFRNYAQLLGPYNDLCLRHVWGQGQEFTISIAWIDPAEIIAASYDVSIPKTSHIGCHKPLLQAPLRPGVWTVRLMYKWDVVVETKFLITPLTMYHGHPINRSEAIVAHGGPTDLYSSKDFSEFKDVLGVNASLTYLKSAVQNSKKFGRDLEDWIDSLTTKFWTVQNSCFVDYLEEHCPKVDLCKATRWSSRSPDPKSKINKVDLVSGLLRS